MRIVSASPSARSFCTSPKSVDQAAAHQAASTVDDAVDGLVRIVRASPGLRSSGANPKPVEMQGAARQPTDVRSPSPHHVRSHSSDNIGSDRRTTTPVCSYHKMKQTPAQSLQSLHNTAQSMGVDAQALSPRQQPIGTDARVSTNRAAQHCAPESPHVHQSVQHSPDSWLRESESARDSVHGSVLHCSSATNKTKLNRRYSYVDQPADSASAVDPISCRSSSLGQPQEDRVCL